ncbi:MAG TPA: class I SAM-dependent methyltransferase [Thermoplasmata archaeon]|nr:class I SAM-dependent methyltransferase [Thermoplasmata archaeon]
MPLDPWLLGVLLGVVAAALAYFVFASFLFGAGYQPTPPSAALEMLRLAELTPRDTLYDLGAGTGALVFRAVRLYGARAVGVEVEPIRVLVLRLRRALSGAPDRLTIRWGNMFDLDFSGATVVATFLWPGAMERLRPKFEAELRPGARVVSHCHPIDGWTAEVHDPRTDVYLYRWPAARGSGSPEGAPTGGR